MKQCPQCKRTYADDSLSFCLEDGAPLYFFDEGAPTVVRAGEVRINIDPSDQKQNLDLGKNVAPVSSNGIWKALAAVFAALLLLIIGGAIAGAVFYYRSGKDSAANRSSQVSPTPKQSPTVSQKLPEPTQTPTQTPTPKSSVEPPPTPRPSGEPTPGPGYQTVRINSPSDGFLALRNEPDTERGERIAKIPHNSVVLLDNCEKSTTNVAGKSGRWCTVTYQGRSGWVFSAWLIYQ